MRILFITAAILIVTYSTIHAQSVNDLSYVEGSWTIKTEFYNRDGDLVEGKEETAKFTRVLDGTFIELEMSLTLGQTPFKFIGHISYDRFHERYRISLLDDVNAFMDIYEGTMADGKLTLDNEETGTGFPIADGEESYGRMAFEETGTGFTLRADIKNGKAGNWIPYMKLSFHK